MGFFKRIRQRLSELIGSTRRVIQTWTNNIWTHRPSFDWNRVDYGFYDRLRRGQAEGLEKSGLLLKPIVSKMTAWTMGRPPEFVIEGNESLQQDLNDWWNNIHNQVQFTMMEAMHLADAFIVFNGDGSLTILPPDIVFPIVADETEVENPNDIDYGNIIGWRVMTTQAHPMNATQMRIIDEYYADRRVRSKSVNGTPIGNVEVFTNPLGRIPIIHVAQNKGINERFGRPFAEPMLPLLHDYGTILDAGLDGNVRQGRPVFLLEFDSVTAMDAFWARYGETETWTNTDGTTGTNEYLDVDLEGIVTLANAKGEFKSPGSASADTIAYLEILYYLFLEHTEMPEFLMGSAIASSKASAEVQMPPFVRFVELLQSLNEYWILELAQLAIAYLDISTLRRADDVEVKIVWNSLTDEDNRLTLDTLKWAFASGLIDDENAVRLMPVEIEDAEAMLDKLKKEREANRPEFGDGAAFDNAMNRDAAAQGNGNTPPPNNNGDNADAEMYTNGNGHHHEKSIVIWN